METTNLGFENKRYLYQVWVGHDTLNGIDKTHSIFQIYAIEFITHEFFMYRNLE